MQSHQFQYAVRCALLVVSMSFGLQMSGCGQDSATPEPFVADLTDQSYSQLRQTRFTDANGKLTVLTDFSGRFIWLDYAAPWCSTCDPQSRTISALERSLQDEVVFLTVITSDRNLEPATPQAARDWAHRYDLQPSRVLVGAWARFLPKHVLFSPTGQTLFRHTGLLTADQITNVLLKLTESWEDY